VNPDTSGRSWISDREYLLARRRQSVVALCQHMLAVFSNERGEVLDFNNPFLGEALQRRTAQAKLDGPPFELGP
jgi:hypothetical protein